MGDDRVESGATVGQSEPFAVELLLENLIPSAEVVNDLTLRGRVGGEWSPSSQHRDLDGKLPEGYDSPSNAASRRCLRRSFLPSATHSS